MSSGFVIVDKPSGCTSHDVVARVRKHFRLRGRVGHAGTLDPMATGVLVIAVDRATRLLPYLLAHEKEYVADVAFGRSTDTLDRDGVVTGDAAVPPDLLERIPHAIHAELLRTEQVPPHVSAIHVDGERAHDRARRGEAFEMPPRPVRAKEIEFLGRGADASSLRFRLAVEKGYYIRSFARDLATHLGTLAHLTALRRTRSGDFTVEEAVSISNFSGELVTVEQMATRLFPRVTIGEGDAIALLQGKRVAIHPVTADTGARTAHTIALFSVDGRLLACQRSTWQDALLLLGEDAVRFPPATQ